MAKRKRAEISSDRPAVNEPARVVEPAAPTVLPAVLPAVPIIEIPASAVYQGSPMGDTLIKSLNGMIRQLLITTAEAKKILVRTHSSTWCMMLCI